MWEIKATWRGCPIQAYCPTLEKVRQLADLLARAGIGVTVVNELVKVGEEVLRKPTDVLRREQRADT